MCHYTDSYVPCLSMFCDNIIMGIFLPFLICIASYSGPNHILETQSTKHKYMYSF